jgi:hypothetical protein
MFNIPLSAIGINLPYMYVRSPGGKDLLRPITDHPAMIQNTVIGPIATLNVLNPDSPIAPAFVSDGISKYPADGKTQMVFMAGYIINMFKKGVCMLALQEIPPPNTPAFNVLVGALKNLDPDSKYINPDDLARLWAATKGTRFGASILYNPNVLHIQNPGRTQLEGRAVVYESTVIATGQVIPVAVLHGDYTKSAATTDFIARFNGFCLGDTNLLKTQIQPGRGIAHTQGTLAIQSIEIPQVIIGTNKLEMETVDIIQDTFSRHVNPKFDPDVTQITPAVFDAYQEFATAKFNTDKKNIQDTFVTKLNALKSKIESYTLQDSTAHKTGNQLYETLDQAQKEFFKKLTLSSDAQSISKCINTFRETCKLNVKEADKLMGHGWLYRAAEILIKSVIGLIAAFGMVLGVVIGQGLVKATHRKMYAENFLTWNKTDSNQALDEFKTDILGTDAEDQGLLDKNKIPPSGL